MIGKISKIKKKEYVLTTHAYDERNPWVCLTANTSVAGEHECSDDDDGEAQKGNTKNVFDERQRSESDVMLIIIIAFRLDNFGGGIICHDSYFWLLAVL